MLLLLLHERVERVGAREQQRREQSPERRMNARARALRLAGLKSAPGAGAGAGVIRLKLAVTCSPEALDGRAGRASPLRSSESLALSQRASVDMSGWFGQC